MPRGRRRARGDREAAARRLDQERRARRRVQHRQRSEVRRVVAGSRAALARAGSPTGLARPGRLPHDMAALAPRGRRGILGGSVLVAVGTPFLLQAFGVQNASAYLFLALGLAFGAAWFGGSRQYVYLVPAASLITFGLGLVIPTWLNLSNDLAAPIFLGALAIGFGIVFLVDPHRGRSARRGRCSG